MHRWCALLGLVGCSQNAAPAPLDPPVYETVAVTASASPPAPVTVSPAASSAIASAASNAPLAFSCAADADCVWDDPCVPRACVVNSARRATACDESMAPDGTCSCVEGICSKKPKHPVPAAGTCDVRGCVVDYGRGRCIADTGGVAENLRGNTRVNEGPSCDCIAPETGCQFNWFDAVPCKSALDCWVTEDPRPRPVPRPKHLRRPFVPCKDGVSEPVCEKGKCRLGNRYKC
jgi:hypothetical protein